MTKTDTLKKNVLAALEKSLGIVSTACREADISRQTFYQWCRDDAAFKKSVDDIENVSLDVAESKLFNLIEDGNITAIIFYLKTKGKKRGYIEKAETEVNNKIKVTLRKVGIDAMEDVYE